MGKALGIALAVIALLGIGIALALFAHGLHARAEARRGRPVK